MNTQAWHEERRTGLGGSDIGAILGLSKYRTPVDVWMEKTGRVPPTESTLQMRFGTYAEEFVAREYTQKTGRAVQRYTKMLHHRSAPVLGNVDRLVIPDGSKVASHMGVIRAERGLECKTASAFAAFDADDWGAEGTDEIPPTYLVQCATYMMLTDCGRWDLAVLFGNQEVRVYNLIRDLDLEQEIISRASIWWNTHVIQDCPPEPICENDVKLLFPKDNGAAVEADPKAIELLTRAQELKAQIAALEAELEGDKKAGTIGVLGSLKTYMGEASRIVLGDQELATWKAPKDSAKTDWEAIAKALNAPANLIQQHTTTKPGARRFLIKG